jgi:hypothetical protein
MVLKHGFLNTLIIAIISTGSKETKALPADAAKGGE